MAVEVRIVVLDHILNIFFCLKVGLFGRSIISSAILCSNPPSVWWMLARDGSIDFLALILTGLVYASFTL